MPTGQLSWWQVRTMRQPSASRAAVPKPYSSAPSRAARTTSRPVLKPPSPPPRTRPRARAECQVGAGLGAAVDPDPDPAAEPAGAQGLLRLGESHLPGRARVLD